MKLMPLRWLVKNLSTLLTAFVLAVIVWVSAVWAADPNESHVLERNIPIEFIGQSPSLQLMGDPQDSITLTLNAPSSVWKELNSNQDSVRAWVDFDQPGSRRAHAASAGSNCATAGASGRSGSRANHCPVGAAGYPILFSHRGN